jgi:L-fuconate dehydratase
MPVVWGLCEYVQHLQMFDYVSISASMTDRVIEFADHLHEHFVDPVRLRNGRYLPTATTWLQHSNETAETLRDYVYPQGVIWQVADINRKALAEG